VVLDKYEPIDETAKYGKTHVTPPSPEFPLNKNETVAQMIKTQQDLFKQYQDTAEGTIKKFELWVTLNELNKQLTAASGAAAIDIGPRPQTPGPRTPPGTPP
jgi:hypothetical protein